MSKKIASLALALLLLATLLISTSAAQTGPNVIEIPVLFAEDQEVTTNDFLVLRAGWLACTPGLVRAFIKASHVQVNASGFPEPLLAPEDVRDLWGPVRPIYREACNNPDGAAVAGWRYEWGQLPAGEYEIHTEMWTNHAIPDGLDNDGDGKLDTDPWYAEHTFTITVE